MKLVIVLVTIMVMIVALPVTALADCCLAGPPTVYYNYSGQLSLPIGGVNCAVNFAGCEVWIHDWVYCKNGVPEAISFEVVLDGTCNAYVGGIACPQQSWQCETVQYPNYDVWRCFRSC